MIVTWKVGMAQRQLQQTNLLVTEALIEIVLERNRIASKKDIGHRKITSSTNDELEFEELYTYEFRILEPVATPDTAAEEPTCSTKDAPGAPKAAPRACPSTARRRALEALSVQVDGGRSLHRRSCFNMYHLIIIPATDLGAMHPWRAGA